MSELSELLHYGTIALSIGMNAIGVGIGQGLTGRAALVAIDQQPSAQSEIKKTALLGIALIETAAVMGGLVAILLLRTAPQTPYAGLAELGIALAICLPGMVIGVVSSWPAQSACIAVARQPFLAHYISRFMTITQALIQAPVIFGLLVALFISNQTATANSLCDSLRLIGAGLCIGIGSIGPAIGLALFSRTACYGMGVNPKASNNLLSFTFVSAPLVETPVMFALIVSLMLLFSSCTEGSFVDGVAFLSAGLCTGLGTIGTGIGSGITASAACNQIALKPESHSLISWVSMFGQGIIETCSIYAVLISFLLIFFR